MRQGLLDRFTAEIRQVCRWRPSCTAHTCRLELPDAGRRHLTWAGGRLFDRPVSPVGRPKLRAGGLCLYGPAPVSLVPPVTDQELAEFIRRDLRDRWRPVTGKPHLWLRDLWWWIWGC